MEVPRAISIEQLDARDYLGRTLALNRESMREARKTVLNDEEVSIAVDPLHPVLLRGHEVARQMGPHASGVVDVRPL
eukprot:3851964-Alexandrium_andersonii.AAC.1